MRFSGKIYKDGQFWLAEIPLKLANEVENRVFDEIVQFALPFRQAYLQRSWPGFRILAIS